MRGHAATFSQQETVTREQNLDDVLAAYDLLESQPTVDAMAIAVWAAAMAVISPRPQLPAPGPVAAAPGARALQRRGMGRAEAPAGPHDHLVPHQMSVCYPAAFSQAHSLSCRFIDGADHGLSAEPVSGPLPCFW